MYDSYILFVVGGVILIWYKLTMKIRITSKMVIPIKFLLITQLYWIKTELTIKKRTQYICILVYDKHQFCFSQIPLSTWVEYLGLNIQYQTCSSVVYFDQPKI